MKEVSYKVLVADDEYWIRENLRTIIDWQGYSLVFLEPAVDGEDALRKLDEERPDILITDINMPFVNGVELLTIVNERYPGIVTIIISGYSDFDYVRETLLAGAVDYLLKPLTKINLINVLNKAIDAIGKNEKLALDNQAVREKLQIASSLLQDKELSMMIAGEDSSSDEASFHNRIAEMELDLSGFSLVLVKICNSGKKMKGTLEPGGGWQSIGIKSRIEGFAKSANAVIFNNVFVPNEFILVTDEDKASLCAANARIIRELEEFTGFPVNIAVSNHYFSLQKAGAAYNEALSAIRLKEYVPQGANICFEDASNITIKRRIGANVENELIYSLQNKNKKVLKNIIFDEIGLRNCSERNWLFIEVKQTIDRIIGILLNHAIPEKSPQELLAIENLADLLGKTLESFNIAEVCSVLEQIIDEYFDMSDSVIVSDAIKDTVKLVAEYINENYADEISLTSLSKRFLVESSYLSKMFKRYVGENLMLYIAKKRIEKAMELMKQDGLSLTDISYLVGYDDYTYFNRVFRKIAGRSPRDFKMAQSMFETGVS